MQEENSSTSIHVQVKNAIKSLNLDQRQLAERLGITQAAVSKALNGKSDRSLQRLVALLSTEHGVDFSAGKTTVQEAELTAIRKELQEIREVLEQGMKELKDMMGRKD